MTEDEIFMQRCIQLAKPGLGYVAPNPMVGSVLVLNHKIISEGYHQKFGEAHAEVNAIRKVEDALLCDCTLYVNLEPCSHFGKTPPCADLIIEKKIRKVVIGCADPFKEVAGKGIERLKANGVEVISDICKVECIELNKRFFTAIEKKRPYIILKYAQTDDGFIGIDSVTATATNSSKQISNQYAQRLTHRWRSEEAAILVGTITAIEDNPQLNVRLYGNNNPVRIVFDRELEIPTTHHLFDGTQKTIIFNQKEMKLSNPTKQFIKADFHSSTFLEDMLKTLLAYDIQSVLVEGGAVTLQTFINAGLWDEARVFTAAKIWGNGIKAPSLSHGAILIHEEKIHTDTLITYKNSTAACF